MQWRHDSGKFAYVLASHSHFFMQDLFDTDYWKNSAHGGVVLPGWIVGTAGARRYPLPDLTPEAQQRVDRVHDALANDDTASLLAPLLQARALLSTDHPILADRITAMTTDADQQRHSP